VSAEWVDRGNGSTATRQRMSKWHSDPRNSAVFARSVHGHTSPQTHRGSTVFICDECVELCWTSSLREPTSSLLKSARRHSDDPKKSARWLDLLRARQSMPRSALGRRFQPLPRLNPRPTQRRRTREVEHPADRSDRFGQETRWRKTLRAFSYAAGHDCGATDRLTEAGYVGDASETSS